MKTKTIALLIAACCLQLRVSVLHAQEIMGARPRLADLFFETAQGRTTLPADWVTRCQTADFSEAVTNLPDGRLVKISIAPEGKNFLVHFAAKPDADIVQWGFTISAGPQEHFTGLMERVVDGPQAASWAPGITSALNLRGQKVDMLVKPTTSVYAPFYLSSRGYALFVQGDWPGRFDFCASDPDKVKVQFEGPSFAAKIYTGNSPAKLIQAHALDAGPPLLPPKWVFGPWRWRDEHVQRQNYYDGTPVHGPFNAEFMEDVLLMKAYGIPCSVYWVDRPWGPGQLGYDDFEIDAGRLPNFAASVKWLADQDTKMMLWIGPFFQGHMATNAISRGYTLIGQKPGTNNYPLVDFTKPSAKKYWQDGVAKLLKLGVAGFKLDRAEEDIPENGTYKVFDGRTIRENRNVYPALYLQAAYDVARQYRGRDFVCMPRAAYTGSAPYGVFWGGDIAGTPEGLRASIIAVQRAAVMGYPNWGSDTGGYNQQSTDTDLCSRWLAFSCFTPIMEVGPTQNRAFWNFHNPPEYDAQLIAVWRFYARLHDRLKDYSYDAAKEAHKTGMPIVRPLFLVEPKAPAAWSNWWTYLYGADILVSPVWQKGQRMQQVYLPAGNSWRDAWNLEKIYDGGQTITINAALFQMPIFIRDGSGVKLGDLKTEWHAAVAAADTRPDLKVLDEGATRWFKENR